MKIFLDSADIEEITLINTLGIIDGITTNPSLLSKASNNFSATILQICKIIKEDISVEVVSNNFKGMVEEGNKLLVISRDIVIKLPMTLDGLKACNYFIENGYKVNMTLCFSSNQALLAAKMGATYVSPFIGRLEDTGMDGLGLIRDIKQIYSNYNFKTKILAASIRNLEHVRECALIGSDAITMPGKMIKELVRNSLTDNGLAIFNEDWAKSNLVI